MEKRGEVGEVHEKHETPLPMKTVQEIWKDVKRLLVLYGHVYPKSTND
jgi:hypothetical protein